jgi:hypothetical protein
MSIYLQQAILAAVVVFIVDLSGFTDSWRDALARALRIRNLRPLKPFDCSLCMTWWTCLIYPICTGDFSLLTLANAAALALLSQPLSAVMLFIVESLNWLFNKITPR